MGSVQFFPLKFHYYDSPVQFWGLKLITCVQCIYSEEKHTPK